MVKRQTHLWSMLLQTQPYWHGCCPLRRYINTMANVLAPRLVPPHLKPTAAGLMAITYQTSHFMGLLIATLSALLLYGDIGVE